MGILKSTNPKLTTAAAVINGNSRILKWMYCTIKYMKPYFGGYISLQYCIGLMMVGTSNLCS